jgi:hypothetical protein
MVDDVLLFSEVLLMGISIILLILNFYTFRLTKNKKVLVASGVFIIFFIQGLLVFLYQFWPSLDFMMEPRSFMLIDVLVILVIYSATVKK